MDQQAPTSAAAATRVLHKLKEDRARHERVLAGIEKRRADISIAAAQGDADARAALVQIDADEGACRSELRICIVAIARAQTLLENAAKSDREASRKQRDTDLASLSGQIVEDDRQIVELVQILCERMTHRADTIADVLALRILSDHKQRSLCSAEGLADALHDGLLAFLNVRRGVNTSGALRQFAARDADILGIEIERPEKTVIQRALERSTEPTRFVSYVHPLSKPAVANGR